MTGKANNELFPPDEEEIERAHALIEQAFRPRALPVYTEEELSTRAVLKVGLSDRQRTNAKAGATTKLAKTGTDRRRSHVRNMFDFVLPEEQRSKPLSKKTLGAIMDVLDKLDFEDASLDQIKSDIRILRKAK